MIERLQRIAKVLSRIRGLLLILAGACGAGVVLSLVENPWVADDSWLLFSFMGCLWFLVLYSLSQLFLHVPPPVATGTSWHQRLSLRIRRSGMWILGAAFLLLSLALFVLSYQLLRVSFM